MKKLTAAIKTAALFAGAIFVTPQVTAQTIDAFDSVAAWSAHPSDGVTLDIAQDTGQRGNAMRLDFDFHAHTGYAIARRAIDLDLPANYAITFAIRADAPVNNLELKLIDSTGDDVWWSNRRDFVFPKTWTQLSTKKRQISFAWGPIGGGDAHHIAAIELVVTAGSGGRGHVWIDDLTLTPLPPTPTEPARFSRQPAIDFGERRELGGVEIEWSTAPRDFTIVIDGNEQHHQASGPRSIIWLPDIEAQKIEIRGGTVAELIVQPPGWAPTANDFAAVIAKGSPRGHFPRYLLGEQPYWTVIGADGGEAEALVGEDGSIEPFKSGFSIEPFLVIGKEVLTWADVTPVQSLQDGDLPVPSITWKAKGITLTITATVTESSMLLIRYRIRGTKKATLYVAFRPFQVNPSTQFLNITGGVAPIKKLRFDGSAVVVNGTQRVQVLTSPARFTGGGLEDGDPIERMQKGPARTSISDATGHASGVLVYPDARDVSFSVPLGNHTAPATSMNTELDKVAGQWREKLHRVAFEIPARPELGNAVRMSVAYMLIQRDGAALKPGSRSYDRAWIRDGSLMASVLLRFGQQDAASSFAEWFAGYQFPNGKVPCCVDHREADPVPENDSHGELIHIIAEVQRLTRDTKRTRALWPHVDAAARYIDLLRSQNHGQFEGLMTESISHEGYSAKPMHSYWDDLFALRGLDDAAYLAGVLGFTERERGIVASAAALRHDLSASIRRTIEEHHIDYVPGSAELGDFDATSTAIGISPLNLSPVFPQRELKTTFDRYLANLEKPRADYTPYETRIIGALIRMGDRERALPLIDRFQRDLRPAAWNEWAEVVNTDVRRPTFLGDMPHAWVASDFVRSMLDAFAFDDADGALIIGAGVPRAWLKTPVHVGPLPTYSGTIDIRMHVNSDRDVITLKGSATAKLLVRAPDTRVIREVTINGRMVDHAEHEVVVKSLPATVVFSY